MFTDPDNLDRTTVADLVQATMAGDSDAFTPLIRVVQGRVWAVCNRLLLPRAEVEELVQVTLVQAYEHLDRFDQQQDFGGWVCGIARNVVRMHLRDQSSMARRLDGYRLELERELDVAETAVAAGSLHEDARLAALRACCGELDHDARTAIELRYLEDRDYPQIAASLGRTLGATRRLLSRVRLLLRDCIEHKVIPA